MVACHTPVRMSLLKCVILLSLSGCLCQKDCTGVDCPVLDKCIEEVLESGACCATCVQTGCACEGYQYYDCVNAGFRYGKVAEGESYFVDFGSTECACPLGGGRISCHFIPCPEIPANCIEASEPADGCIQCERVGCVHEEHKYEAGHSFHMDPCQVCHCPNDGGSLMCYPIPDCDPSDVQKPMLATTTEENTPEKHYNDPIQYIFNHQGAEDRFSKPHRVSHSDSLPPFKQHPSHMEEEEDYDYPPTDTSEPSLHDLVTPTQSAIISVSYPESSTPRQPFHRGAKQELRERLGIHEDTADREILGIHKDTSDRERFNIYEDRERFGIPKDTTDRKRFRIHEDTTSKERVGIHKDPADRQIMPIHKGATNIERIPTHKDTTDRERFATHIDTSNREVLGIHKDTSNRERFATHTDTSNREILGIHKDTSNRDRLGIHKDTTDRDRFPTHMDTRDREILGIHKDTTDRDRFPTHMDTRDREILGIHKDPTDRERLGIHKDTTERERFDIHKDTTESERLGIYKDTTDREMLGIHKDPTDRERLGIHKDTTDRERFGIHKDTTDRERFAIHEDMTDKERLGIYEDTIDSNRFSSLDRTTEREGLAIYDDITDKDGLAIYEDTTDREGLAIYDDTTDREGLAIYDDTTERESLSIYDDTTDRASFSIYDDTTDHVGVTDSPPTVGQTTPQLQQETTVWQTTEKSVTESQIHPQRPGAKERDNTREERVVTLKYVTGQDGSNPLYTVDSKQDKNTQSSHDIQGQVSDSTTGKPFAEHSAKLERKHERHTFPPVKFSPTSQPPLRVKADEGHRPKKQPQTLFNFYTDEEEEEEEEREERDNTLSSLPKAREGVSAADLLESCCEAGQKWATENHHCDHMPVTAEDQHSVCSIARKQCCSGFLKESRCLAGVNAAKGGEVCEEQDGQHCGEDSYRECCSCCSLGLRLRREGKGCEAHQHLGYPCGHVLLTCCEADERGPGVPPLRRKERPRPTAMPKKVSDSTFPKEAFSITDAEHAANSVEELEDVDECQRYEGQLCHHTCINTWGSYECVCHPGYTLLQDAHTCAPENPEEDNRVREEDGPITEPAPRRDLTTQTSTLLNPCAGNGPCTQQCTVVAGRARCSCFPGFSLMADRHTCEDVNECRSGLHNCSRGDFCVNERGSFQCVRLNELCDEGFIHNVNRECVDLNECLTNTHTCQANERCVNTVGAFVCERRITCPPGYQLRNGVCEDIDECVTRTHNCADDTECQNTDGSFSCNPKQRCFTGFTQDTHGNCIDIDECSSLSEPCSPGFNCINTVGSYTCQRKIIMCSQGYHSSPDGARCIDVDECQTGTHRCGESQICHNLPGSYRCDCQTGYQYNAIRQLCIDVNECWRYPGRLCAQTCENTPGSYQCSCTMGFSLAFDGKNCEDVNECDNNPCSQECANIYGSYQCYCRKGFYLKEDGHTCEDIDECSQSIGNLCAFQCVNVPGSYQCACPPHGYSMSPNGRTCRDVDECAIGAHNCSAAQTCYNIQGSFRCLSFACPQNYRKVSDTRCERTICPNFQDCQNAPLRITYYQLSFQTNIVIPAQIFRIGPSPAYSGDNIIISITRGNEEGYFSTRRLNSFTGAVYLQRQVLQPRDFLVDVEMKLLRQGTFTTFLARIYVFITANSL